MRRAATRSHWWSRARKQPNGSTIENVDCDTCFSNRFKITGVDSAFTQKFISPAHLLQLNNSVVVHQFVPITVWPIDEDYPEMYMIFGPFKSLKMQQSIFRRHMITETKRLRPIHQNRMSSFYHLHKLIGQKLHKMLPATANVTLLLAVRLLFQLSQNMAENISNHELQIIIIINLCVCHTLCLTFLSIRINIQCFSI